MMKPRFVTEIIKSKTETEYIEPITINDEICSEETIKMAQKMMTGVASHGTAANEGDFIIKATHKLSKATSAWVGYQNDDNGADTTVAGIKHSF